MTLAIHHLPVGDRHRHRAVAVAECQRAVVVGRQSADRQGHGRSAGLADRRRRPVVDQHARMLAQILVERHRVAGDVTISSSLSVSDAAGNHFSAAGNTVTLDTIPPTGGIHVWV